MRLGDLEVLFRLFIGRFGSTIMLIMHGSWWKKNWISGKCCILTILAVNKFRNAKTNIVGRHSSIILIKVMTFTPNRLLRGDGPGPSGKVLASLASPWRGPSGRKSRRFLDFWVFVRLDCRKKCCGKRQSVEKDWHSLKVPSRFWEFTFWRTQNT